MGRAAYRLLKDLYLETLRKIKLKDISVIQK